MKKVNLIPLSLSICASVFLLSGCNTDSNDSKKDSPKVDTTQLTQLSDKVASLTLENQSLKLDMTKYTTTFAQQCDQAGYGFEYVDLNANNDVITDASKAPATAYRENCTSCHTYGVDQPVKIPHGDKGNCKSCHSKHTAPETASSGTAIDPHAATFAIPNKAPSLVDGKTGASGSFYYKDGSYLNADYLLSRVNGNRFGFEWIPATEKTKDQAVTTLVQACKLPKHENVAAKFPNDGKEYVLHAYKNFLGAKILTTVNKVDDNGVTKYIPNIATFGYGMEKDETNGNYYMTMSIGKNNSCYNAIMNKDVHLEYYEYNPALSAKFKRNQGARIFGTVDYKRTSLKHSDWTTEVPGLGKGEDFAPADVTWDQVGACSLSIKVNSIIPLG